MCINTDFDGDHEQLVIVNDFNGLYEKIFEISFSSSILDHTGDAIVVTSRQNPFFKNVLCSSNCENKN